MDPSPLYLISPISRGHLALSYVLRMTRLKRLAARRRLLVTADTLLAKADRLNFVAFFRHHDVRFRRVLGGALWLVVTRYADTR